MRKLGSLIMLLIMILSVIPTTEPDNHFIENIVEDEFSVNVSGTRASVQNDNVTFTSGGATLTGHLYYTNTNGLRPAVVFGVGYSAQITDLYVSSNYDWLAEKLADRGYVVLVIRYWADFQNIQEILSLTGDYTLWINQTKDAVTALLEDKLIDANVTTSNIVDPKRMALGGHSIGGAVSIVAGAQDRRIKSVFVLSPKNFLGSPRMNDYINLLSPTPIQLQVGQLDALGGIATAQQSYNTASMPKQLVTYRYGTYEGFTDVGSFENLEVDVLPTEIRDTLAPILQQNPLTTHQQPMSYNYTASFLDHYLMESSGSFDFKSALSEPYTYVYPTHPIPPPQVIDDVWRADVEQQGLDEIFQEVTADPAELDFAEEERSVTIRARITPRRIWEEEVKAKLIYPEGAEESYDLVYNDHRNDTSAGYFGIKIEDIPISHTLGTVEVQITAKDANGIIYTHNQLTFELTTTADPPTIESVDNTPDPILPGDTVTFTITTKEAQSEIAYYFMDFGDGNTSGWVASRDITYVFKNSGQYSITARAKNNAAAESDDKLIQTIVSNPPEAKLEVDSTVEEGDELDFDASGSSDEDGDDLDYFFDFGDGIESGWISTAKTSHRYDETGEITVSVKVRDQYGMESEIVEAQITVKENKGDSPLSALTSSSSFPIIILIVVAIIILGGFFLLRGEEDTEPKSGPGPKGAPALPKQGKPGEKKGKKAIPAEGKKGEAEAKGATTVDGKKQSPALPRKQPGDNVVEKSPVKPSEEEEEFAKPISRGEPDRVEDTKIDELNKPDELPPEKDRMPLPPPVEPSGEPEIDAPPLEEESWDDLGDEDDDADHEDYDNLPDHGENSGNDSWEDDDFAIPVALKEKLQKESE